MVELSLVNAPILIIMDIYLAIGGSEKVKGFIEKYNLGWCIAPDNARDPKGIKYFLDNGAFHSWFYGTKWNETKFKILCNKYPNYDFVVAPDIVCGGELSLVHSLKYSDKIKSPLYLAVQDGMNAKMVIDCIDQFDGLFIGGSITWKFQTARMWADIAHLNKIKCRAGRVGTWEGLTHMHFCGVDSVDSSSASRNRNDYHIKKYYDNLVYQQRLIQQ